MSSQLPCGARTVGESDGESGIVPESARQAHESMLLALDACQRAERSAVLCFAEIHRRRHFCALGFGSIHQYAEEALGFSRSKTFHFLRLIESLQKLPALRAAVTAGEIGWTKAREVVKVATPDTEQCWVEEAKQSSRRQLEQKVIRTRAAARPRAAQPELSSEPDSFPSTSTVPVRRTGQPPAPAAPPGARPAAAVVVPTSLTVRMTSLQKARFEVLLEKVQKQGVCGDRAEVLLAALEDLAVGEKSPRGDPASPYQIVVSRCPSCGRAEVQAGCESRALPVAQAAAIECDARVLEPGRRNLASIPPSTRREVLARDGHRCRTPGCRHTRFLEVHHVHPRAEGGTNRLENLVTLCSSCHRIIHERNTGRGVFRAEP